MRKQAENTVTTEESEQIQDAQKKKRWKKGANTFPKDLISQFAIRFKNVVEFHFKHILYLHVPDNILDIILTLPNLKKLSLPKIVEK